MVKGISRRVIVVRSPDPRLFEQAIFLVKEDAVEGVSAEDILDQATDAAERYLRSHSPRQSRLNWLKKGKGLLWFAAGAVCALAVAWII